MSNLTFYTSNKRVYRVSGSQTVSSSHNQTDKHTVQTHSMKRRQEVMWLQYVTHQVCLDMFMLHLIK